VDLRFGATSKQAIPDIAVMDVLLSFMRMIVVEDKKSNYLNSERN
jgi:hypothetical protein